MIRPGAFSAVATNRNYAPSLNERWLPTVWLPLPVALLCQRGHDLFAEPVAVCVPRFEVDEFGGEIHVDGILRSDVPNTWRRVLRRELGMSIYGYAQETEDRDGTTYVTDGVLISVDLVERPLNRSCRITSTTSWVDMTDAQREVQRRFDTYLAEGGPHTIDYRAAVGRTGSLAMHPLRPVVCPLLEEPRESRSLLRAI